MRNLKNLSIADAKMLTREQTKTIKGGIKIDCSSDSDCPFLWPVCSNNGHCIRS